MDACIFINQNSEDFHKCKFNKKYGDFCFKHKDKYLLDENGIIVDKFTYQLKDYRLVDLLSFCKRNKIELKSDKKEKKLFYYKKVEEYIKLNKKYEFNIDLIIKIQSFFRDKLKNKEIKFNNTEDFYTYDPLNEINPIYFYYYKDNNNLNWGFDIRSLIKLIDMNYPNPYTTEKIPENIIKEVKKKNKTNEKR